jgi:putative ABC transport system substrate-binding protein
MRRNGTFYCVAVLISFLLFGSCNRRDTRKQIGLLKMVSHPQLDMIENAFIAELGRLGYADGDQVVVERKNAQGEIATAQSTAKYFVDSKKDLIVALTTPCAQSAANLTKTIPVVFIAVTDPVGAGIVQTLDQPGVNVTGVSDFFPVERQIDLILRLVPTTKRIGMPYDPAQQGSVLTLERVEKYASQKELSVVKVPVANSSEVYNATKSLIGRVDVVYTASDITIATAYEAVIKVCSENKLPFFVSAEDGVQRGAVATLGLNYEQSAKDAAALAKQILDGKKPSEIPVKVYDQGLLYVNTTAARKMGVTIPQDLLTTAAKVYQ